MNSIQISDRIRGDKQLQDEFERIWIDENVNKNYTISQSLDEDTQIMYTMWKRDNWVRMHQIHMHETNLMRMMMISRIEELWPYYSKTRLDPKCSRWHTIEIDGVHVSSLNLYTVPEPVLVRIFEMFIRRCQTMM